LSLLGVAISVILVVGGLTEVKVIKAKEGMYWAKYEAPGNVSLFYQVDTVAQLCFVAGMYDFSEIDCQNLAKRPEWKNIITWISSGGQTEPQK
jgi:hypothetical protein